MPVSSFVTVSDVILLCRHRGTGVLPDERRLTQHIIIRRACAEWVQSDCWVPRFASAVVEPTFIGRLSPWQRSTLGMPPPGDPRWDKHTLAATATRYDGFDVSPYSTVARQPGCLEAITQPPAPAVFTAEEARSWRTRGWVVFGTGEPMWSTDMLCAAAQAAANAPIPDYDSAQQRLRPNGAMGGQPLVEPSPFTTEEGDVTVMSLGELPFNCAIDALAFAPSAVSVVAQMMGCLPEDVRLCRSELVGIVPALPIPRDRVVRLWQPQQYSLLSSDWNAQRLTDGVACLLFHDVPHFASGVTIETDGVIRGVMGGAAALYDVTQPHAVRIPRVCTEPLVCSILLWRRRDADWIGWEAWGKKLSGFASLQSPSMGALQRGLLGWPAVGSTYWQNKPAFDGAAERYGHDVMTLYTARM